MVKLSFFDFFLLCLYSSFYWKPVVTFCSFSSYSNVGRRLLLRKLFMASKSAPMGDISNTNRPKDPSSVEIFEKIDDPALHSESMNGEDPLPLDPDVFAEGSSTEMAIYEIHNIIEKLLDIDIEHQQQQSQVRTRSILPSAPPKRSKGKSVSPTRSESLGGILSVNPQMLLDKSEYLCKEGVYDAIINYRFQELQQSVLSFNQSLAKEDTIPPSVVLTSLKRVHSFLRGFIMGEKKSRARLKINYLLAGADVGEMETAIKTLAEANEIDQFLFSYLSQLINSEQQKLSAIIATYSTDTLFRNITRAMKTVPSDSFYSSLPSTPLSNTNDSITKREEKQKTIDKNRQLSLEIIDQNLHDLREYVSNRFEQTELETSESEETEDILGSNQPRQQEIEKLSDLINKNKVLKILLLLERRLQVEVQPTRSFEIRLLGELLNLPTSQDRVQRLSAALTTIEMIESFEGFLQSGVNYVQEIVFGTNKNENVDEKEKERKDSTPSNQNISMFQQISPEKLQMMKELLFDLQEIRKRLITGYNNSNTIFEVKSSPLS